MTEKIKLDNDHIKILGFLNSMSGQGPIVKSRSKIETQIAVQERLERFLSSMAQRETSRIHDRISELKDELSLLG